MTAEVAQLPLFGTPLDRLIEHMQSVSPDPPAFGSPVGCSRGTSAKHHVYLLVLNWFLKMHGASIRQDAQFLIGETHAGPGWYLNSTTGELTVGSPLIDLDVLDHHPFFVDRDYRAIFCELGKPRTIINQLRQSIAASGLGTHGVIDTLEGSFETKLPAFLSTLQGWHCGVLFVDGNGSIARNLIRILQDYQRQLRYVDVAIWHQTHVRKRFVGLGENATGIGGKWHGHVAKYDYRPLREVLPEFGKRHWLIRRPFNAGFGTAWTMLIGSNMPDLPEWRAGEMYRLDTLKGQAILAECDD